MRIETSSLRVRETTKAISVMKPTVVLFSSYTKLISVSFFARFYSEIRVIQVALQEVMDELVLGRHLDEVHTLLS